MFEIALYNILKRVGGVSDAEAREVADNVASSKEVATKADIKDMATKADIKDMATKTDLAELETRLTRQMYAMAGIIIGAITLVVKVL